MIDNTLIFIKSLLFKINNLHIYTLATLDNSVIFI